jgi:hypothetical protein
MGVRVRSCIIGGTIGALCLCAAGLWSGCDRADASKKAIVLKTTTRDAAVPVRATPKPASRPVASSQAAVNAKPQSFMMINGVWVEFNDARLVLKREEDNRVHAFLSSNDGAEVLKPDYQGNRYYFEMALDTLDDPKNLTLAEYRYKAASAEPVDSPNGIFIDGDRQHLQPYDIEVTFDRDGDKIVAQIRGQFIFFPKDSKVGQWVPVMATLSAKPITK